MFTKQGFCLGVGYCVLLQVVPVIDWFEHCHPYSFVVSDTDWETVPLIVSDTDCETVSLIVSDTDCETVPLIVSDTDCETVPLIVSDTDCETVPLIVSDTDCETVPLVVSDTDSETVLLSAGGAGDDLLPGRVAVSAARLENGQDSGAGPEGQAGSAGQSTQWVSSSRVRVSESAAGNNSRSYAVRAMDPHYFRKLDPDPH